MKSCPNGTHCIESFLSSNPIKILKETSYEKNITYFNVSV